MEKKEIAVLIPCYNEELTIAKVVKDFKKVFNPNSVNMDSFDEFDTRHIVKVLIRTYLTNKVTLDKAAIYYKRQHPDTKMSDKEIKQMLMEQAKKQKK